jgi:2-hydroxycyclohexanecarboxyl-CoA dehydrogenase
MDLNLSGHTALVTGSAAGIGRATAELFASEGCSLLLWDHSPQVREAASEISSRYGIEAQWQWVDIANLASLQQARDQYLNQGHSIDHVVHCAAIGSGKFGFPFTNLQAEDWRNTLEVNIMGMTHVAIALTPHLIQRSENQEDQNRVAPDQRLERTFVFLASVAGQIGSQTDPPYSASKAANINFAQCMAKDLAKHNIRVNTVCPGMVKTELNRSVWQAWHDSVPVDQRLSYEQWSENKIKSLVPLGRWQTAEDIASMIVFLSSSRARQVTGQTINVDGGFVMHS